MEDNPYKTSENLPESRSASRFWLWSGVIGFALGFAVSWALFRSIAFVQGQPRDYTQSLQKELRDLLPADEWKRNAIGRNVGRFTVIAATGSRASAEISPARPNQWPGVIFDDENSDGLVDSVHVADASHRTFSFDVADGRFKGYNYTDDLFAKDAISFRDGDMDGQFDFRVGPGRKSAVMIDSVWRDVIEEGGKRYVDLNGARTPIELVGGVLKVVREKNEE
jgi:hypothetical protein